MAMINRLLISENISSCEFTKVVADSFGKICFSLDLVTTVKITQFKILYKSEVEVTKNKKEICSNTTHHLLQNDQNAECDSAALTRRFSVSCHLCTILSMFSLQN